MKATLVILKPDADPDKAAAIFAMLDGTGARRLVGINTATLPQEVLRKKLYAHYQKDNDWYFKKGSRIIEIKKSSGLTAGNDPIWYGKQIIDRIVDYMTERPLLAVVYVGDDPVPLIRNLVGDTEPISARPGTIRHTFSQDSYVAADAENRALRNVIHCSDSDEEAKREIGLWFDKETFEAIYGTF